MDLHHSGDNEGSPLSRRRLLARGAAGGLLLCGSAAFSGGSAFAEELARTAWVEEGPFYPRHLPLDTDNDLLVINDSLTPAVGEITHLSGRLLDTKGDPIRNAVVEIWQVDGRAVYLQDRGAPGSYDANFQGFGRFLTGSTGEYYFRTIKPVRYPGRMAPHVHFKVKRKGQSAWTTQLFIQGYPGNLQDGVYRGIGDEKARQSVTVPFVPVKGSRIGELAVKFDIAIGFMPDDAAHTL